jgi:hypothetical protein
VKDAAKAWDGELVRRWLDARCEAARLEQAAADKRGFAAQGDYDDAAAEEWVCQRLKQAGHADDQVAFAAHIKALLAQDEYPTTGIHDDRRFDRSVRANLRKLAKMTGANDGFANTLRYRS